MGQSKHTKRALLASVLSVVACCALLIGSTFAWFTDEVTSGNNKIVAGNLDIKLSYQNGATNGFEEVTSNTTNLFVTKEGKDILWEPGVAAVTYLKMENAGSLALKYLLSIAANDVVTGDDGAALSKVLKSAVMLITEDGVGMYDTRAEAIEAAEAAGADSVLNYNRPGTMEPKAEEYLALIVYFPEEVGNEVDGAVYNRSGTPLEIDLSIRLEATQTPYEKDSFDENYDAGAEFPGIQVGDLDALKEALDAAKPGDVLQIAAGVYTLDESLVVPEGVTLKGAQAGNLATEWATGDAAEQTVFELSVGNTLKIGASDVVLDGLTIDGNNEDVKGVSTSASGTLTGVAVRNCYVKDCGNDGINLANTNGAVIENNYVFHVMDDGIHLNYYNNADGVTAYICNNTIEDVYKTINGALRLEDGKGDVVVKGNTIRQVRSAHQAGDGVIDMAEAGISVDVFEKGGTIRIEENTLDDVDQGIAVYKFSNTPENNGSVMILNNTVTKYDKFAIGTGTLNYANYKNSSGITTQVHIITGVENAVESGYVLVERTNRYGETTTGWEVLVDTMSVQG